MEQLWSQPADGSEAMTHPVIYSPVHGSHPSVGEPCQLRASGSQHCSAHTARPPQGRKNDLLELIFFLYSPPRENLWMAAVHPNPLNNRKCPRSRGGGGGCYCLLAGDLLQPSTLAGVRAARNLARGRVGLAWDVAVGETGIKKWSGAAFVGKPLQILTEGPKLRLYLCNTASMWL